MEFNQGRHGDIAKRLDVKLNQNKYVRAKLGHGGGWKKLADL